MLSLARRHAYCYAMRLGYGSGELRLARAGKRPLLDEGEKLMMNALKLRRAGVFAAAVLMACVLAGCATGGGGAANPFVGNWNFTVESQLGTIEQVVKINDDLTGMITSLEPAGEMSADNIVVDGNNVTFDVVFDIEGEELEAQFVGVIDGDNITGEYITDLGNGTVTGSRAE